MKWESKDSNLSASDLQSVPTAPASFPFADDVGIEPRPEGLRQFSRLFAPMRGTIQAEKCGPDPQTNERPRSLAGWPYPGRLPLQRDRKRNRTAIEHVLQTCPFANIGYSVSSPGGIRTRKIQILSLTRLPVAPRVIAYSRKDSNLQIPDPKSGAFTSLTTGANKKASQLREAFSLRNVRTAILPILGSMRGSYRIKIS